ncbi:MAG: N-acetylneuraminate synthase family protein [Phycisphaerae bacterium]|nr:N-acetylneuraminate synthase family protein [Phycisphaerae bacterium]
MDQFIEFNSRHIGPGCPVCIVAEIGSNHNRDLPTVCRMIDEAARAGVDAVKFQTFYADDFISKHITPAEYGLGECYPQTTWQEALQEHLILPFEWYDELVARIRGHGLGFVATVHSTRSLSFALGHQPDALKIASMDLTNTPLLAAVASAGLPMLISTGMGSWADIERAVQVIDAEGCRDVVLMHCVSEYPADYQNLHLRFLGALRAAFLKPVGFSDHSLGVVSSVVAVALGAGVIEKHFTLDRTAPGPDHSFSLEPGNLQRLVTEIRQAEQALGDSRRRISEQEKQNAVKYRRSVVANGPLQAGDAVTRERIKLQRPGHGIPPYDIEQILGCTLTQDVDDEQVITWGMLCCRQPKTT